MQHGGVFCLRAERVSFARQSKNVIFCRRRLALAYRKSIKNRKERHRSDSKGLCTQLFEERQKGVHKSTAAAAADSQQRKAESFHTRQRARQRERGKRNLEEWKLLKRG
jgi:shikimate kinase